MHVTTKKEAQPQGRDRTFSLVCTALLLGIAELSALHDNRIRVCRVAEDRLQRLVIVLVEEVLLAERHNLLVQEVEECFIALRNRRRNRIVIAEAVNADLKARVRLGPCDDLGVVGRERITSAIKQRIVCVRIGIILLELYLRVILLKIGLCRGTLRNDQGLAL